MKAHQDGDFPERWKKASAAVRITRDMVTEFIKLCVHMKVQFVCAPYEGLLCSRTQRTPHTTHSS